jgi:phospholipid/cholesterol/gamma-HCH transport system substrate-binding protein
MARDRNALRAGIFIVASVIAIIGIVIATRGVGRLIEPNQTRTVAFGLRDDVGGLRLGDDVRVGGFKVGVIRDIEVVQGEGATAEPPSVMVTFTLPERFVVREDAEIGVSGTLTGTSWLNFESFGQGAALPDGVPLQGTPGRMSQFLATAAELAPTVRDIVIDVRTTTLPKVNETIATYNTAGAEAAALVRHVDAKVDPTAEKIHHVADRAGETMVHARDLLGDTKGDIRDSMANVSAATGSVKDRLPGILEKADASLAQLHKVMDGAMTAMGDVKDSMVNVKDVTAAARSVIVGNRGKIDDMIESLKASGDNLKFASAEIRRSPWRLLYKPGKGEVANLTLYDSARQFAEGANDLNDAATALRDALNDPQATPERLQKLVSELDKSFAGFKSVEDALWKRVQE